MDVFADEDKIIYAGASCTLRTGLKVQLPEGFELQVRSRSGLAAKHEVMVLNSPGTVDTDYRGELLVLLANFSPRTFTVARGDRIAQLVVSPVYRAVLEEVASVDDSARGAGGFGSTGVR